MNLLSFVCDCCRARSCTASMMLAAGGKRDAAFSVLECDKLRPFGALKRNSSAEVALDKRELMERNRSCGLPRHFHTR